MKQIYDEYQNGTADERTAMEQKYGKIFHRILDEMASLETIKVTARQCPHCSIYTDVGYRHNRDETFE
jgi:hypothetical protein